MSLSSQLSALMRSEAIERGDIDAAVRQLTEVAAATLRVERASVWRFDLDCSRLVCVDLFERKSGTHTSGAELFAQQTPAYFAALATERSVAAHDALTDPRTREFSGGYLERHGITSMLDAPVFLNGRLAGVVCHEHVGPARTWEPWEELLAGTFGDFVSIVLGAAERAEQARSIDYYREHLEALVEDRTRDLKASEARFQLLFESAPVALVMTRTSDGTVAAANAKAAAMFGVPPAEVLGLKATDFWVEPAHRSVLLERVSRDGAVSSFETQLKRKDDTSFWADVSARVVRNGREAAVVFGIRDVTAQKTAEEQLRKLATTDSLTGALNRRRIFELAKEEVERAQRYGRPLAIAMLDLDHFKAVNDRFGHATGDAALREVSRAVSGAVRKEDKLGRYGGEELLLLMPETRLVEAAAVVERARLSVRAVPAVEDGSMVALSLSAGVVELAPGETFEALLVRADRALYSAKQNGRDRVVAAAHGVHFDCTTS